MSNIAILIQENYILFPLMIFFGLLNMILITIKISEFYFLNSNEKINLIKEFKLEEYNPENPIHYNAQKGESLNKTEGIKYDI